MSDEIRNENNFGDFKGYSEEVVNPYFIDKNEMKRPAYVKQTKTSSTEEIKMPTSLISLFSPPYASTTERIIDEHIVPHILKIFEVEGGAITPDLKEWVKDSAMKTCRKIAAEEDINFALELLRSQ